MGGWGEWYVYLNYNLWYGRVEVERSHTIVERSHTIATLIERYFLLQVEFVLKYSLGVPNMTPQNSTGMHVGSSHFG